MALNLLPLASYLFLLIPTSFLWAHLWSTLITNRLYYCSDPSALDFLAPPFVHPLNSPVSPFSSIRESLQYFADRGESAPVDFYMSGMNAMTLTIVWLLFALGAVVIPAIALILVKTALTPISRTLR